MSLNKWVGIGRITKDLEKKVTPSGVSVMNFTIAVEDDYKPKDGDRRVAFVDCVAWRGTADFLEKWSGKGRNICVTGSWWPRKWEDKDGNKRTSWEVQVDTVYFADSKKDGAGQAEPSTQTGYEDLGSSDSDLPF